MRNNTIVFIVEGEVRELDIFYNIQSVFFPGKNISMIVLPAGQNIYMLWKKLKDDDFQTDVIELIRENPINSKNDIQMIDRSSISEIYLFFDCDPQHNSNFIDDGASTLQDMLNTFDNETDLGKLYISYPMAEALRDISGDACASIDSCYVKSEDCHDYKRKSSKNKETDQFKKYSKDIWCIIMSIFVKRVCCLNGINSLDFDSYRDYVTPIKIFDYEKTLYKNKSALFILSAFPEFLLDYFQKSFWLDNFDSDTVTNDRVQNCRFL